MLLDKVTAPSGKMAPVTHAQEVMRLQRIAVDVRRIALALAGPHTAEEASGDEDDFYGGSELIGFALFPTSNELRLMIRERRLRERFFRAELFADPAWDILLDLLVAHLDSYEVSVSSLCIAAAVPPTTALRWIATMADEGLLDRSADPTDKRRINVALAPKALDGLSHFFTERERAFRGGERRAFTPIACR